MTRAEKNKMNKDVKAKVKVLTDMADMSMNLMNNAITPEIHAILPDDVKAQVKEAQNSYKLKDSKGKNIKPSKKVEDLTGSLTNILTNLHTTMQGYGS